MAESTGGPQDPSGTDSFSGAPNPGDTSSDQPWYRPTDTSIPAPVDEVGLDAPTVARNPGVANLPPEALMPQGTALTRDELSRIAREQLHNSSEVVEQRLAAGVNRVQDFMAKPEVVELHSKFQYEAWAAPSPTPEGRKKTHEDAFDKAIENAKQGKLGVMKLAVGQASGNSKQIDNNRNILQRVTALRGYSGFHELMDAGRRPMAETVIVADRADEAGLLKAMALGQDQNGKMHDVAIIDKTFGHKSILSPLVGEDYRPTGMWLRIESSAFDVEKYDPMNSYKFDVSLLVPPYGESPAYTEEMRIETMKPIHDKFTAFKSYMDKGVAAAKDMAQPALKDTSTEVSRADVTLGGARLDTSVSTKTQIVAGKQHFSVDWNPDGTVVLSNHDVHGQAWQQLSAINLSELPYDEQRQFRTETIHDLASQLASTTLAVGQAVTIGRAIEGPRLASDDELSRQHFSVELQKDGTVRIMDLNSSNGTFVFNDQLGKLANVITEIPQFTEPAPTEILTSDVAEPQNRRRGLLRRRK